ncbi:acyl-CoA dehydrogenase family protein [Rhodococcus opacus]|nr:acyl-CoA dehydrogenase family protein [Rhodococcus opacus]
MTTTSVHYTWPTELTELRDVVAAFRARHADETTVRALFEASAPLDSRTWQIMSEQLGLAGLIVPEELGGVGAGYEYLAVAMEELGKSLLPSPLLATTTLAIGTLMRVDDSSSVRERLLPALAAGQITGTLAYSAEDGHWDPRRPPPVRATSTSDGWRLDGTVHHVLDGDSADLVLVAADAEKGPSLFAVEGEVPGLVRSPMATLDATRRQARLEFRGVSVTPVGILGTAAITVDAVLTRAAVVLAAEQVGGAQYCLDAAVEYAGIRTQFGRAIGSYQAIKHKCVDMYLDIESARAAVYYAASCLTADAADAVSAASIAKALASEAFTRAATDNIQIHGGIGFTWEHPAHLYFRRATSTRALFGDPRRHNESVAASLLD